MKYNTELLFDSDMQKTYQAKKQNPCHIVPASRDIFNKSTISKGLFFKN